MDTNEFDASIDRARTILEGEGRVSHRALKRKLQIGDDLFEDIRVELVKAKRWAIEENGETLVWRTKQKDETRVEPERRQLSVMFCDLVGSTKLSEQLGSEDYLDLLNRYQNACAEKTQRYEGHIAQFLGDGLVVYFGYPHSHDDDAVRAVQAGLDILNKLPELNENIVSRISVRIGIHTGTAVVSQIGCADHAEQLAVGDTPNIAARVQSKAVPDEMWVSASTHKLIEGMYECTSQGKHPLKGISIPVALYRVDNQGASKSRFDRAISRGLTPIVGRHKDLRVVKNLYDQVVAGNGHAVLLEGEAGIGKSRFVQEIRQEVRASSTQVIPLIGAPYDAHSAFFPFVDCLKEHAALRDQDPVDTQLSKLESFLDKFDFPDSNTAPLIAGLLRLEHFRAAELSMLSPQRQMRDTQKALVDWLTESSRSSSLLVIFEDLHWTDPSTLAVVTLLLERISEFPILALLTYRPEFTPVWQEAPQTTWMKLGNLTDGQTRKLIHDVTGGVQLPAELSDQISVKTDGVPLFVEELTRTLIESEDLVRENNHFKLTKEITSLDIPLTLQASLMARLDRLGDAKQVAQIGSTIGKEFDLDLLSTISKQTKNHLIASLEKLIKSELVHQTRNDTIPQYAFRHSLIQATAYDSLLQRQRREYHKRIARALEKDQKNERPEVLAHHLSNAELSEKAVNYWQLAGQQAIARSANEEAVRHLSQGLAELPKTPNSANRTRNEMLIQALLSVPLMAMKGWAADEVEKASSRALQLSQSAEAGPELFPVFWGLWNYYIVRANLLIAQELANHFLQLSEGSKDENLILTGKYMVGDTQFWRGDLESAAETFDCSTTLDTSIARRQHALMFGLDPKVATLARAAWVMWLTGDSKKAMETSYKSRTIAEAMSHPFSQAWATFSNAMLHQFCGERRWVQERAEELVRISQTQGYPHWEALGHILKGWATIESEDQQEQLTKMTKSLEALQKMGTELTRPYWVYLLAEVNVRIGRLEEAMKGVESAMDLVAHFGEKWFEPMVYMLKGEIQLKRSANIDSVEKSFNTALNLARSQGARTLELQSAQHLTRLWHDAAKSDKARQLLTDTLAKLKLSSDETEVKKSKTLLWEL